jgi:ABC-type oligopeptide transport system substrate-binding subunit
MRRSKRLVALVAGLALVAAACGGDDDDDTADTGAPSTEEAASDTTTAETGATDTTTAETGATDTTTAETGGTGGTGATTPAGEGGGMTVTVPLNPDAVWDDGTPITIADLQCTLDAVMNTPGSLTQDGYNKITSLAEGSDPNSVVMTFSQPYAAYKNLFNFIIKADFFADCKDVSADLGSSLQDRVVEPRPGSARPERGVLGRRGEDATRRVRPS